MHKGNVDLNTAAGFSPSMLYMKSGVGVAIICGQDKLYYAYENGKTWDAIILANESGLRNPSMAMGEGNVLHVFYQGDDSNEVSHAFDEMP